MPSAKSASDTGVFRLVFLGIAILALLGVLLSRLHEIQIRSSVEYVSAQDALSFRRVRLPATRGRILDRNGTVLADNRARFCAAFYLDELRASGSWSNTVDRIERQIETVSRILGRAPEVDRAGIWAHLKRRRPIPLIAFRDLTEAQVARLAEWPQPLQGVDLVVQQDRVYPYGDTACHIIGYVGKGNPVEELDDSADAEDGFGEEGADDFDFFLPDITGRDGIEKRFDSTLAGRGGGQRLRIDAVGYKHEKVVAREPVPGRDVTLALDLDTQLLAERALEGQRGAAVVLDVASGDILAMASAPRYDLSSFVPTLSRRVWKKLIDDPARPLYHRAACGVYPPGSVVKPVVALAALGSGAITEFTPYECHGAYSIGPRTIRCSHRYGHGGPLCVADSIAVSCNPFFIDAGLKMGYEPVLRDAYASVGFGVAPSIGILTGSGTLPSSAWKRARFGDRWRDGDTGNISIGQGFLAVTPLQIARMALCIARNGELVEPRLVRDPGDGEGPRTQPAVLSRPAWSAHNMEIVRSGMLGAVESDHGTARRLRLPGVRVAAKTGPAEYNEDGERRKHAWMICYAPAEAPRYAIAVLCENADTGGSTAAAVAREVLCGLFGIIVDEPHAGEGGI